MDALWIPKSLLSALKRFSFWKVSLALFLITVAELGVIEVVDDSKGKHMEIFVPNPADQIEIKHDLPQKDTSSQKGTPPDEEEVKSVQLSLNSNAGRFKNKEFCFFLTGFDQAKTGKASGPFGKLVLTMPHDVATTPAVPVP